MVWDCCNIRIKLYFSHPPVNFGINTDPTSILCEIGHQHQLPEGLFTGWHHPKKWVMETNTALYQHARRGFGFPQTNYISRSQWITGIGFRGVPRRVEMYPGVSGRRGAGQHLAKPQPRYNFCPIKMTIVGLGIPIWIILRHLLWDPYQAGNLKKMIVKHHESSIIM